MGTDFEQSFGQMIQMARIIRRLVTFVLLAGAMQAVIGSSFM